MLACQDTPQPGLSCGSECGRGGGVGGEADTELKEAHQGWRPRLGLGGVWSPKAEFWSIPSSCFSFQTLSMAYLTGMLSR